MFLTPLPTNRPAAGKGTGTAPDGRSRTHAIRWGLVFLGYLLFVAYLSFYPFQFVPHYRRFALGWYWLGSRRMLMDFTLNVWLYIPLGALTFLSFGRRISALLLSVLAGASISLAIEYGQLYIPGRVAGLPDFAANALGTMIGAVLAYAASGIGLGHTASNFVHSSTLRLSPDRILLLALWILSAGFPFFPDLHAYRLLDALGAFTHVPRDWSQALQVFLGFLILTIALRGTYWMAIAFAMIPAQTLLEYHAFSLPNLIAAAAAWVLGSFLRPCVKQVALALSAAVLLGLLAEELRPFRFGPGQTTFGWMPFESFVAGNVTEFSGAVIFAKLFLYGCSIWLLRTLGWTFWASSAAVIAVLAVGEWSQRLIPGRAAESTDVVLAAASALLVMISMKGGNRIADPRTAVGG